MRWIGHCASVLSLSKLSKLLDSELFADNSTSNELGEIKISRCNTGILLQRKLKSRGVQNNKRKKIRSK